MKNTTLMQEQILDLIEQFCDVLRTNYQSYAIHSHRKFLDDPETKEWHQEQIDKLAMGDGVDEYIYEKGRKYARIIHVSKPSNQRSAHAFVDMNTGDVYKSASWKSPAKGIRYNLIDDKSREEMYQRADWAGGYLYK
jgi:hypothetical protein